MLSLAGTEGASFGGVSGKGGHSAAGLGVAGLNFFLGSGSLPLLCDIVFSDIGVSFW